MAESLNTPDGALEEIFPNSPVEMETRKAVLSTESDTGISLPVRKSKAFRFFTLQYQDREWDEYNDIMEPFFERNYPELLVEWTNEDCGVDSDQFYLDAPLKYIPVASCWVTYTIVLRASAALPFTTPMNSVLPFQPDWGYTGQQERVVNLTDAVSFARAVGPRSSIRGNIELNFEDRTLEEFLEMENFWNYHYPGKPISFIDKSLDKSSAADFFLTSDIKATIRSYNSLDYSLSIKAR